MKLPSAPRQALSCESGNPWLWTHLQAAGNIVFKLSLSETTPQVPATSPKASASEKIGILAVILGWAWAGFFLLAGGWLVWSCRTSPNVGFLPGYSPAHWILDYRPAVARVQSMDQDAITFRRTFNLDVVPASATVSLRAFKTCLLFVNSNRVDLPSHGRNWKEPIQLSLVPWLKRGKNLISVKVSNQSAPPALWLALNGPQLSLISDESWEACRADGSFHAARVATQQPQAEQGDVLAGQERTLRSLAKSWRWLSLFALLSAGIIPGSRWWFSRIAHSSRDSAIFAAVESKSRQPTDWPRRVLNRSRHDPAMALFAVIGVLWICLMAHNIHLLPQGAGFDSYGHLEYIQYIQGHAALPLANDGWEMHQPPLYYLLCAAVLDSLGLSAADAAGLRLIRWISLVIGLAHTALILGMLRLLFPQQAAKQTVGLALAAFVPMQLYLAHYPTNESLAACFMAASLYLAMQLLCLGPDTLTFRSCAALGLCLGLAMLTKVTALVIVPVALAAVLYSSWRSEPLTVRRWLFPLTSLGLCLAVCGWHFWRVWRHFGHAFFPVTRSAYGISWWQDPGYRTAQYFLGFGRCLDNPFYSGLSSFADGLYSTLWGDGLWGGAGLLRERPPWNYTLMSTGFLLALLPSVLILAGLLHWFWKLIRRPEPSSLIVLVFSSAMLLALIYLNLMVPTYAVAKAFYGLAALGPLCAFAAQGWELLVGRSKLLTVSAGIALTIWALSAYASFWCS